MTDRLSDKIIPVLTILIAIVAIWYVGAVALNAPFQRDLDRRAGLPEASFAELVGKTLSQPKPTLPAPHQVAQNVFENTFLRKITSNRSLVYNAWVTLSSTLLGFAFGTALGILIAVGIVHVDGARPQPDAVDHRLADHSHPCHRADDHRGAGRRSASPASSRRR